MEAAGLLQNLPCLVIRGICDCADSHKNGNWEEHAAAVAAAFTKELLGYVYPEEVQIQLLVKELLDDILSAVQRTEGNVIETKTNVERM
ncbi:hypothetical protein H072_898 [Dactylellina haptotyla CBS 200.50]|uniref:Nucleoside phosphorylase domain-containing protein n=1 Tax=Dactylellina haptotyla (strain CBS 200.50) TaxID=1284197 RepID=S8CBR6_DACHA|nr:hypothetical protein H072_898 [Dactylellina haptotyla CBS 200.50]